MIHKETPLPFSVNVSIQNIKKQLSTNDGKIPESKKHAKEEDTKEIIVIETINEYWCVQTRCSRGRLPTEYFDHLSNFCDSTCDG